MTVISSAFCAAVALLYLKERLAELGLAYPDVSAAGNSYAPCFAFYFLLTVQCVIDRIRNSRHVRWQRTMQRRTLEIC